MAYNVQHTYDTTLKIVTMLLLLLPVLIISMIKFDPVIGEGPAYCCPGYKYVTVPHGYTIVNGTLRKEGIFGRVYLVKESEQLRVIKEHPTTQETRGSARIFFYETPILLIPIIFHLIVIALLLPSFRYLPWYENVKIGLAASVIYTILALVLFPLLVFMWKDVNPISAMTTVVPHAASLWITTCFLILCALENVAKIDP